MFDYGVTINGKDSIQTWGLYMKSKKIEPPEVRTQLLEVPGRNGSIDLSESLTGDVTYNNRIIDIVLNGKKRKEEWPPLMSSFMNEIHGKMVNVVLRDDPQYYYHGRAYVQADFALGVEVASFTLQIDADPFKYERFSGTEDWLWDPFSFVDGVIREYNEIEVNGETELIIPGTRMPVIPVFATSAAMSVSFGGRIYQLSAGQNKIYDIVLRDGENVLKFTGIGTVSVDYRGGSL